MSSHSKVFLGAGPASTVGEVIDASGCTSLHLWIKLTLPAAFTTLSSVVFAGTPDGQGDLSSAAVAPPLLSTSTLGSVTTTQLVQQTQLPTGWTINAANAQIDIAATTGVAGMLLVRLVNPPEYVVPRFVYGAGGGAMQLSVSSYGYSIKTR